jgi:hypothetical protein
VSEQAKAERLTHEVIQDGTGRSNKKRYICTIDNCLKSFYQKTHLDIHERSHTGDKPYVSRFPEFDNHVLMHGGFQTCEISNCGRTFSQLGNLKVHYYPNSHDF